MNKTTNDIVLIIETYENEFVKSEDTDIFLIKMKKSIEK